MIAANRMDCFNQSELMNYIRNIQSRRDETITAFENALIDIITKLQVR